MIKNKRGITLVALVVTVVILIILGGVGIYLALNNNGLINKAEYAKDETLKQTATEKINLKITTTQMNTYAEKQEMPTLQEFADVLCEDKEIEYVELESKVANLSKITVGSNSSIYTKLKEYPYEFEINSSLQLASIDGVKINDTQKAQTKVLFEGEQTSGTITFEDTKIDDYNYFEFIYGIRSLNSAEPRIFNQIVSKEFLQMVLQPGGLKYFSGLAGLNALVSVQIDKVTDNSITFTTYVMGTSWPNETGYIYKIIGR